MLDERGYANRRYDRTRAIHDARKFVTCDSWRSLVSHFSIWYAIVSLSVLCYLLLYFPTFIFSVNCNFTDREKEREREWGKGVGCIGGSRCTARFAVQKLLSPRHSIFAKTDFWVNSTGRVGICFLYCRIWYATPIFYYLLMRMYMHERARGPGCCAGGYRSGAALSRYTRERIVQPDGACGGSTHRWTMRIYE